MNSLEDVFSLLQIMIFNSMSLVILIGLNVLTLQSITGYIIYLGLFILYHDT